MATSSHRVDFDYLLMVKAAWYYYIEGYTQQHIADLLGVTRTKVVAMLERARQTGVVSFNISHDADRRMRIEQRLLKAYDLQDVFVVPACDTLVNTNESIAQAAAMYILRRLQPGAYINIGYGDTTSRILNHLATNAETPLDVVSLTGGVNYYLPNTHSSIFNARLHLAPSPLLVSDQSLRDALRGESDVDQNFRLVPLSAMSVIGIGSMDNEATILSNGILTKNDFTLLKLKGAVGDVLSHFIDENGQPVSDDLERRLISTSLEQLRSLENVIGVAGGPQKVEALTAVLNGGYLDVLITDEQTASTLLREHKKTKEGQSEPSAKE